jgi:hypothetical protein
MGSAARFVITSDTLTPGLRRFPIELLGKLRVIGEYYSDRARAYAQTNASWQDQTGNARQLLDAQSLVTASQMEIVVYHGVPYGIWLEVRWSGRYAIIIPTLETIGPEVMGALRAILR